MPLLPLLLVACTSPEPVEIKPSLSDDIPTVVLVDLLDDHAAIDRAYVEFGADGSFDRVLDFDLAEDAPLSLVGFKPETDVSLRVVVEEGDQVRTSEETVVTTGSLPTWLPTTTVEVDDGAEHFEGGYLLTSVVTTPAAAVIIDGDGDFVWWTRLDGAHQVGRVRLSRDGRGVYAMPINIEAESERGLIFTPWAGGEQTDTDIQGAHHDFVELADGTLGLIQEEERIVDDVHIVGDVIVEQAADGTQTAVWSAWSDIDPALTPSGLDASDDWTHGNVLVYDEVEDDWLISLMGIRGIARVDRGSGAMTWLLGSAVGDFTDPWGETDFIDRQHVFELTDQGIVYFENGGEAQVSRGVELALDLDAMTAEETWSYTPDPEVYNFSLGGLDRLPGGDTVITFSVNGRIDEVAPDSSLRWRLSAGLGGTFGYSEVVTLPGQ